MTDALHAREASASGQFVPCVRCGNRPRGAEALTDVTTGQVVVGSVHHPPQPRVLGVDPWGNVAWEPIPGTEWYESVTETVTTAHFADGSFVEGGPAHDSAWRAGTNVCRPCRDTAKGHSDALARAQQSVEFHTRASKDAKSRLSARQSERPRAPESAPVFEDATLAFGGYALLAFVGFMVGWAVVMVGTGGSEDGPFALVCVSFAIGAVVLGLISPFRRAAARNKENWDKHAAAVAGWNKKEDVLEEEVTRESEALATARRDLERLLGDQRHGSPTESPASSNAR